MRDDWWARFRRERRVLARVRRAAWRLEQAERERAWALASARAAGVSVRKVAQAAGLSATRVHQLTTGTDVDALAAELGGLRAAGWPAPEDPAGSDDEELSGREQVADRLDDEVGWIRRCADWLDHLDGESYPPAASIRPEGDWPDTCMVVVGLPRVAAILRRVAYDVEEFARARRVDDLQAAAVGDDPRAEHRRRMAEPDLDFREFCERTGTPWRSTDQGERAWAAYQAERHRLTRPRPTSCMSGHFASAAGRDRG
ncbi:hypothetical protein MXD62_13465 [Frankia sp. Mgl5]|uniref:hypothetical protein n=1 Tax=Frankia sp. Mgl5 TaxID=2933793 RepID=UPI00200D3F38|nr:hypothetical protein [Frankia sp. Mgl5]MCK9928170.1 hypothetical protein [Frankia sp. Mgl5]